MRNRTILHDQLNQVGYRTYGWVIWGLGGLASEGIGAGDCFEICAMADRMSMRGDEMGGFGREILQAIENRKQCSGKGLASSGM